MQTGKIKWYNSSKGYGFIRPDYGDNDVFVHVTALDRTSMNVGDPEEGLRVSFEIKINPRNNKTAAANVRAA